LHRTYIEKSLLRKGKEGLYVLNKVLPKEKSQIRKGIKNI
jgi:hypothetical protein